MMHRAIYGRRNATSGVAGTGATGSAASTGTNSGGNLQSYVNANGGAPVRKWKTALTAVLAMCGTRLLRSSILAAALLSVIPGYLTSFDTSRQMFAFGVIAVAATIVIAKREVISEMLTTFNRSSRKARPLAPSPGIAAPRAAAGTRVPAGMVR